MIVLIKGGETEIVEILLELDRGDFVFWKDNRYDFAYYRIDIEGYIGLKTLQSFVDMYSGYLEELHDYLTKNNYAEIEVADWNTVYKSRAIDICHTNDCYWIFLDGYKSTEAWDVYYYLKDVIEQIKNLINKRM